MYAETAALHGDALERLAWAYEADPDKRQDLIQDIHVALWRSFRLFDGRCSVRTWVYRVAHNTAISQITQHRARTTRWVALDDIGEMAVDDDQAFRIDRARMIDRLLALVHQLKPLDRQVVLLYLEGLDANGISEVTAISARNVATKIHRIKRLLAQRVQEGGG